MLTAYISCRWKPDDTANITVSFVCLVGKFRMDAQQMSKIEQWLDEELEDNDRDISDAPRINIDSNSKTESEFSDAGYNDTAS